MKQECVLIFAKTPYDRTPYDRWLEGTGVHPIILTSNDHAKSYAHLADVYAFADYDHNPAVAKAALALARSRRLVAVFARGEADIIRAAQLRELAGIQGQHTASAFAFRDKVVMKEQLRGSGVEVPSYTLLDSPYTAYRFAQAQGYPLVIKPVSESGSWGTQIIPNEAALDDGLTRVDWGRSEIEKFVEGQMYHVDGLLIDGKVVFIHPFRYINDCLSFRKDDYLGSLSLSPSDSAYLPLISAAERVVKNLPSPKNMAFHCELWETPEGHIVFCEIASRTGGAFVSALINYCFGLNVDKEWLLAEIGRPSALSAPTYRTGAAIFIPPRRGTLLSLPSELPAYVRDSQITGAVGQKYNGGVKSGLFLAAFVVAGDSERAAQENVSAVSEWFARHTKWQTVEEQAYV